ncbi:MAG: ATP-grasp domain-containing protein [Lachnospiraceae bacterium]|nr:ATP-grasp domain-containing protein [Lachnospiraceae bacterium]
MKRVLVLNGSFCETPVIKKLKEFGYYVITTGNAPELEGHKFADEYIAGDYSNKELMLEMVKQHNIDGVVSCANDFGVISAAYISEKMGWKGHDSLENTLILHHKDLFKEYCYKHNIPSVKSVVFTDQTELLDYVRSVEFPIIIKANDLTGGKGIQRANNYDEAVNAAEYAFLMSRNKRILVEPFIEGTQHAVDAFICEGKIVATTSCNCYSIVNPYLIQTETYPSDHEEDIEPICEIISQMVSNLKLVDGIFTVQYIRKDDKIYVIEVMRRLLGNLSLTLYEKATGFPWYEAYIKSSLGLDCTDLKSGEPEGRYCGHHGIFALRNGVFSGYHIPEEIKNHLYEHVELIEQGSEIDDYKHQRIASIFYTYEEKKELEEAARSMCDKIVVNMK